MIFKKGNQVNKGRSPWNKGLKNIHLNPKGEFKKGNISWMKGKHHSEETKTKIRNARIKQIINKESYEKAIRTRSQTAKERGYWLSKETKTKISLAHKGKPKFWLRGRLLSDEHKNKISKKHKGKIVSEKTKKLLSKINTGKLSPSYGLKRNDKTKELMKIARAKQIIPIKDTTIEVRIQNFLKQLGIEFYTHKYIKEIEHSYQCDIFIPSINLVIECDGNYWHSYPTGTEIDHIRTKELIEQGFKVLRLWECEIRKMDINKFRERINV